MPKLWSATIEEHRHEVRDASLDAAAELVAEHGPMGITMSQIAEKTGVGRATLYKYFADVGAILIAWHDRHITRHFEHLHEVRSRTGDAGKRLEAVLEAYALMMYERPHDTELAAIVHRGKHLADAQKRLDDLFCDLLKEAKQSGNLRDDVELHELANYCRHALSAANGMSSKAAVRRLVAVTLDGLRDPAHGRGRDRREKFSG